MSKHSVWYDIAGFISTQCWGRLSDSVHITISTLLSKFYETSVSRFFIKPYCKWQYKDPAYYRKFRPGSGGEQFSSFQDFFTRDFKTPPSIDSSEVWPCEGYLCEYGKVEKIDLVKVKGEERNISTVFGLEEGEVESKHYFSNVFLHNNNYHHIHAPVSGIVDRIQHIPGALLLLRPWAYRRTPSLPALTNERYNVDILDEENRRWLLSIVGGPLVATINLKEGLNLGSRVLIGEKIASFAMGSTCCMVSPIPPEAEVGQMVDMGTPLKNRK